MTEPHLQVRCNAAIGNLRLQVDAAFHASWTVIFGASGSGKSSLLQLIAGLWRPHPATVLLCGHDLGRLPPHRRRIALVSQTPSLFPHLSVRGNVAFGARTPVDPVLHAFSLTALADARPATLSGGESQRVSIARALATEPALLLLDESFTGMHRDLRRHLIAHLQHTQRERQAAGTPMPILSVTHDVAEAFTSAGEVLRMEDGRIVQRGTASEVLQPERDDLLKGLHTAAN